MLQYFRLPRIAVRVNLSVHTASLLVTPLRPAKASARVEILGGPETDLP